MNPLVPYRAPASLQTTVGQAPDVGQPDSEGLDFASLFDAARRRYWIFIVVFVLVFGAAVPLTLSQKPRYTATAAVMMDPRQAQLFQASNAPKVGADLTLSTEVVSTQLQLLQSRRTAEAVVNTLHLDDAPTTAEMKVGLKGRLMMAVSRWMGAPPERPATPQERHQAAVDAAMAQMTADRVGLTYVIAIRYTDATAQRAAAVANAFADAYIQQSLQGKSDATRQAGGYLNDRLRELSQQAASDAAAVQQYKIANNLLGAEGASLTEQEISSLNTQIATARAETAADQARLDTARGQLRRGSSGDDVGAALGSPVIQSMRSQRALLSGQLAELNSRYGPRYPDVLKAQQQLADLDTQIKGEIQRVISNLQASAEVSKGRLNSLQGTLGQSRGSLATNTRAQAGLTQFQQRAASSQTLYDNYLARFKEIMASSGTEQSDARILSEAQVPQVPSSPRIVLDLALGLIVASILGVLGAIIAEVTDQSFSSGIDVEKRTRSHYLGSIPLLSSVARGTKRAPSDYVTANPFSVFAEAFRNLKVSVLQARANGGSTVVAMTSPLSGEGKTTCSVCLGETSSLQGARTIVVDCDLRRRTLQRFLEEAPSVGLVEVIQQQATLNEAIVVDHKTGLHFLPLAQGKLTAAEIFGSSRMDELLTELRARYDFIILDTAPLLAVADSRTLAAKCDAVVLLCRWRKTPADAVKSAVRLLQTAGAPLAGVALTRVDVRKQSAHGYGDSTYYYRQAQEYYAT